MGLVLTNIRIYPGDNTVNQNLPIDPNGVVYSSARARSPVAGAIVTLTGPGGSDPSVLLLGGSDQVTTGVNGSTNSSSSARPPRTTGPTR